MKKIEQPDINKTELPDHPEFILRKDSANFDQAEKSREIMLDEKLSGHISKLKILLKKKTSKFTATALMFSSLAAGGVIPKGHTHERLPQTQNQTEKQNSAPQNLSQFQKFDLEWQQYIIDQQKSQGWINSKGEYVDYGTKKFTSAYEHFSKEFIDKKIKELGLTGEIDENTLVKIEEAESVADQNQRESALKKSTEPVFVNFEKAPVHAETIKELLEQTMPQAFLDNVREIKYHPGFISMNSDYNLAKGTEAVGQATDGDRAIELSGMGMIENMRHMLNNTIYHEAAHLNDFRTNRFLTFQERIGLYKMLVARLTAPDRFKNDEVELQNNENKTLETTNKATEYYAIITAAYLENDPALSHEDAEIVEWVIHKVDPNFNAKLAFHKRAIILAENNMSNSIETQTLQTTQTVQEKSRSKPTEQAHTQKPNPQKNNNTLTENSGGENKIVIGTFQ